MKRSIFIAAILSILTLFLLTSCGGSKSEIPENAALVVTGQVDQEMGWTEDEIQAMETVEAEAKNNQGELKTYTGVPIMKILELAGVKPDATTLNFVSNDGSSAEVAYPEIMACENCILSFRDQGGFSVVAPGFGKEVQIKGVVEIQVK